MNDVVLNPFLAQITKSLIERAIKCDDVVRQSEKGMIHYVNLGNTIISEIDRQTVKKETVNG